MTDDDDAPVYPLLGYGTGQVDEAIVISLEMATDQEEYDKREGSWVSTALTPDQAIEFGKDLIAAGEQARTAKTVN